ncbi:hypothetical protein Vadar_018866 [Vaccinium darrowii]|uniref:Uncharacterized protein n=1 Tax=Vaccinium darrowii TaxID=229202 RepID=A0ACB7Z4U3_9ERIC|nr:hypothetical protein Vadar_018866 [Vaccinium darrowii]
MVSTLDMRPHKHASPIHSLLNVRYLPVTTITMNAKESNRRKQELWRGSTTSFVDSLRHCNILLKPKPWPVPLGYCVEDIRPNGGIEKFRSAAYSNCVRMPS